MPTLSKFMGVSKFYSNMSRSHPMIDPLSQSLILPMSEGSFKEGPHIENLNHSR